MRQPVNGLFHFFELGTCIETYRDDLLTWLIGSLRTSITANHMVNLKYYKL